jgi:hypothetical protein
MHYESEAAGLALFSECLWHIRFGDVTILHCVRREPLGEVTSTYSRKAVKVGRGSAMFLCVDGSRPGEAQSHMTLARDGVITGSRIAAGLASSSQVRPGLQFTQS